MKCESPSIAPDCNTRKSNDSYRLFPKWDVSPIFRNGILFSIYFVFSELRTLCADILIVSSLNKLPAKIVSHWMVERNGVHATHFRCCRVSIIAFVFMKKNIISIKCLRILSLSTVYVTTTISDPKYWCTTHSNTNDQCSNETEQNENWKILLCVSRLLVPNAIVVSAQLLSWRSSLRGFARIAVDSSSFD